MQKFVIRDSQTANDFVMNVTLEAVSQAGRCAAWLEALAGDEARVRVVTSSGAVTLSSKLLQLFSPLVRETIASVPSQEPVVIIIPDTEASTVKHLANFLSKGQIAANELCALSSSEDQAEFFDVLQKNIISLARCLHLDIKQLNLSYPLLPNHPTNSSPYNDDDFSKGGKLKLQSNIETILLQYDELLRPDDDGTDKEKGSNKDHPHEGNDEANEINKNKDELDKSKMVSGQGMPRPRTPPRNKRQHNLRAISTPEGNKTVLGDNVTFMAMGDSIMDVSAITVLSPQSFASDADSRPSQRTRAGAQDDTDAMSFRFKKGGQRDPFDNLVSTDTGAAAAAGERLDNFRYFRYLRHQRHLPHVRHLNHLHQMYHLHNVYRLHFLHYFHHLDCLFASFFPG